MKDIIVYTDGSCSGNGKCLAHGGIGIHFPNKELKDVSKVFKLGCCTNQRTELYAILTAIRYVKKYLDLTNNRLLIKTDSEYSINCITKWVYGWIKNGWMTKNNTPVANRELIEPIHRYYEKYDIVFEHVEAHTGKQDDDSIANARADELATRATKKSVKNNPRGLPEKDNIRKSSSPGNNKRTRKNKKELRSSKTLKKQNSTSNYYGGFPKNSNFIVELVKSK